MVKPVGTGGVVIGKVVHGRVAGEVAVALYGFKIAIAIVAVGFAVAVFGGGVVPVVVVAVEAGIYIIFYQPVELKPPPAQPKGESKKPLRSGDQFFFNGLFILLQAVVLLCGFACVALLYGWSAIGRGALPLDIIATLWNELPINYYCGWPFLL